MRQQYIYLSFRFFLNGGRQVTEKEFTSKWKKGDVGMARHFSKKYGNKGWAIKYMSRCLSAPCYSAVSALLMNPLPDRSNYSPL